MNDYNDRPQSRTLKLAVAENERPREKAKLYGFDKLSVAELLAIIVASGSGGENVVDLCQRILNDCNGKLYCMGRMTINDLARKYRGIGEVKATEILAALELGRRYHMEKFDDTFQVRSSQDAYDFLKNGLDNLDHEEIHVLLLNRSKRIIHRHVVSSGGTAMAVADIKMIIKPAIEYLADSIILAHNHPSDSTRPSEQDNRLTRSVKQACKVMEIDMVDHIIVCRGGMYYSYNDNGAL